MGEECTFVFVLATKPELHTMMIGSVPMANGRMVKVMADGLVPCKRMFSNGSEYEWFIENNCENGCTRFRKGYCRVFRMTEKARFDPKYFPYDALMEYEHYAGKYCKRYTTEKPTKKRRPKLIEGQLTMEQLVR